MSSFAKCPPRVGNEIPGSNHEFSAPLFIYPFYPPGLGLDRPQQPSPAVLLLLLAAAALCLCPSTGLLFRTLCASPRRGRDHRNPAPVRKALRQAIWFLFIKNFHQTGSQCCIVWVAKVRCRRPPRAICSPRSASQPVQRRYLMERRKEGRKERSRGRRCNRGVPHPQGEGGPETVNLGSKTFLALATKKTQKWPKTLPWWGTPQKRGGLVDPTTLPPSQGSKL